MSAALLLCPFCGASAEENYHKETESYYIACSQCTAHTCQHGAEQEDAATAWNRRVAIAPPVAAGIAYDKTSIQINRCKRILELVDTYVDCPTQDHRTALRKALMDEFEAQPVAAGSVNTAPFRLLFTGYPSDADNVAEFVDAWGAQQRELGKQEALDLTVSVNQLRERAEKTEADLKQVNEWRNAALQENMRLRDLWMDRVTRSEARVKELEAALAKAYPNTIDPSNTAC